MISATIQRISATETHASAGAGANTTVIRCKHALGPLSDDDILKLSGAAIAVARLKLKRGGQRQ